MTLVVVPTEGQVEICALRGETAMTRARLRDKLLRALLPDVVFAPAIVARAALASVMAGPGDPSLARLNELGGVAWERTVDAMLATLRVVRRCSVEGSLGAIAAAFDARLDAAKLVDPARAGGLLARTIESADARRIRQLIGADTVVSRWLVRWEPSDAAWWRALSAVTKTSIEMPWIDRPLDATRSAGPLETLLDDIALVTAEPPRPVPLDAAPLGDATGTCDVSRVAISACNDAESQARAAASVVSAALAAGAPIDRLAIVCADPTEEVLAPVRRMLDEIGIPYHDAVGSAPASSGIVAVALDALAIGARGLPRTEVAALLRSRYLDAALVTGIPSWWAARRVLDDLARALESTPSAGGANPAARLTSTAGDRHAALAGRVADLLLTNARTRSEHVAASRHVLRALGLASSTPTHASDESPVGLARTEMLAAARDGQGLAALLDALDVAERAARALGDAECSAETFAHELRSALAEPAAASAAGRAGALRLARPVDVAGAELDVLVVLEASDEAFDRPKTTAGPLLPEAVLARLRQRQPDRAPRDLGREQRLAELVLAAEHASKIVLVYRARGTAGEELAPAALVRAAHQAGATREVVRAGDRPRTEREHRLALIAAASVDAAAALAPSAAHRATMEAAREAWHAGRTDAATRLAAGRIEGTALALLRSETGGGRAMSVTMLERFARCPFQGYAAILAASGDEIARETPDAREEGNLVHEALRIAFERIRGDLARRPRDPDALASAALAAIDDTLGRSDHAATLRNIALLRAKAEVEQVVRAAAADDAWDFALAEQSFGRARQSAATLPWPELVLGEGEAAVTLRGTMDRVDVGHGDASRIRVIDYKRRQDHVPGSELGKKRLQLLVYGVAASRELRAPSFDGAYLPTRAPHEPPPKSFTDHWIELASEPAVTARVLEILAPVRAGDVLPTPGSACSACSFDGACRKPRFALMEDAHGEEGA